MSEIHSVIKFGSKASGITPYGQKDCFPLYGAKLAYGVRTYAGAGDRKGGTDIDTSYFMPLDQNDTQFDQDVVQTLNAHLTQFLTTKMAEDTVTVYEITTSDDSANYKINRSVEHPKAVIGQHSNGFIIISDEATLSTIPEGGKEATNKIKIDFKNRQVNGK